jgi:hypothetical protein
LRAFLKLLGITSAYGATFIWMVSFGSTAVLATAFENVARVCRMSQSFWETGIELIVATGVLSAILMVVAMGTHTFRTGRAPDPMDADFDWALPIFMFSIAGPSAALLCLIPPWGRQRSSNTTTFTSPDKGDRVVPALVGAPCAASAGSDVSGITSRPSAFAEAPLSGNAPLLEALVTAPYVARAGLFEAMPNSILHGNASPLDDLSSRKIGEPRNPNLLQSLSGGSSHHKDFEGWTKSMEALQAELALLKAGDIAGARAVRAKRPLVTDAAGLSYKPFRETISRTTSASPRTRTSTPSGSSHHGDVAASTVHDELHAEHQRSEPSERRAPQRSHSRPNV